MIHHGLLFRRVGLSVVGLAMTALVTACGGGGSPQARVASVSAITADSDLAYDVLATFTVTGTDLDATELSASATNCAQATVSAGGSPTTVKVTCTPSGDGEIALSVSAGGATVLKTTNFTVPKPQVLMTTSLGSLLIELEPAKAPVTVKNFLAYVKDGFYVDTVFHRIISTFMAQGGGYTFSTSYAVKSPTRAAIALEKTTVTGLSNTAGTIAMARTAASDSATSQFFVNLVNNPFLDAQNSQDGNGYAVFGTVVTTPEVNSDATLTALKAVQVINNGTGEVSLPTNPPVISEVTRVR